MSPSEPAGAAYSYIRFSSRKQERGDSVRRQTELRDAWLRRHPGVTLDESLSLADLGVSAFRGKHRTDDKTALSQFLRAVESGRVRPGSYLIVESLDRLTREELGDAFELILGLVNRGVRIVQLAPVESILAKPVNMTGLMLAVVELSRGNSESEMKSQRVAAAWADKQVACRESGTLVTRAAPSWLRVRNGRHEFKPGARDVIRRIFTLLTASHGCRAVAKQLNAEGVPLWTGKLWYEQYVRLIARGREVLGEYQQERGTPTGGREPFGEPIAGYYPAAVTEAEWLAAQAALAARTKRGGRPPARPELVNVFQGLLTDARSGDRLQVFNKRERLLLPAGVKHRGDHGPSFPLVPFERGVLSALAELDVREVLGRDDGPDEVAELSAQLVRMDRQVRVLVDTLGDGDDAVPEVREKIRTKNAERRALVDRLDRAKAKAASPQSAAWGDCRGLIEALDAAPDPRELRLRLKQVLARVVESMTCLLGGKGRLRFAAVRVDFRDSDAHRDYLIVAEQATKKTAARWEMRNFSDVVRKGELDLRDPGDVKRLEASLLRALEAGARIG